MARHLAGYFAIGLLVAGAAGALMIQWAGRDALEAERDTLRAQLRDAAQVRAENVRRLGEQVSAEQLEALRSDQAEVARLREELTRLKKDLGATASVTPANPKMIPANEWQNAGRGTAAEAVQTLFWAAAGGDLDALAATVSFDERSRPFIEATFRALPEAVQKQYQTPERLVAFFTTKDIPLSAMRIVGQKEEGPDDMSVAVLMDVPEAKPRATILVAHRDPDGWRLRVPMGALQAYAHTVGVTAPAVPQP